MACKVPSLGFSHLVTTELQKKFFSSHCPPNEKSSLEAAAEAAAKVNAMLIAKGKLRPNQINNCHQHSQKRNNPNNMVAAEVEINDAPLSMRNMLTRGPTQEEITKFSGAAVSTRGRYMTPVEKMKNNTGDRPLYLFVQGPNLDSVNEAVARINEILTGGKGGNPTGGGLVRTSGGLVSPPSLPQHLHQHQQVHLQALTLQHQPLQQPQPTALVPIQAMHMPPVHQPPPSMLPSSVQPVDMQQITVLEEKLFIGLEHAPPNFDVKGKLLGPSGSYLQHIQTETAAKVMLRGKGSGIIDPILGRESIEPMNILIQHPSMLGLQPAKQLAENLIQTVQRTYASFQQVLAASLPPALPQPIPTAYIAGLQQPSSLTETALLAHPPGIATISAIPEARMVPSAPGLPPQQTVIMPSSSISAVLVPAGSISSTVPTIAAGQLGVGQTVILPTTLNMDQVPVASCLPISTQRHLQIQAPPTFLDIGHHHHLIMNHAPQSQSIAQVNLAVQSSLPVSITPIITMSSQLASVPPFNHAALHPLPIQLGSQPTPVPMPAPPVVGLVPQPGSVQHPSFQAVYSPDSAAGRLVLSSGPTSHIYSVASSSCIAADMPTSEAELPRCFLEKEKLREGLLGYQHAPPHLVSMVCRSPPLTLTGMVNAQQGMLPCVHQHGMPAVLPPPVQTPHPVAMLSVQPQPGLTGGQLSLEHPGLSAYGVGPVSLPVGIQTSSFALQTVHALPHFPSCMSPMSQAYMTSMASVSEDVRFVGPVPNLPPPAQHSSAANGEVAGRSMRHTTTASPYTRPQSQPWSSQTIGFKRDLVNGETTCDGSRKRRKVEDVDEDDTVQQSPACQTESPKSDASSQGICRQQQQSYSPGLDSSAHEAYDSVQLSSTAYPHAGPLFQQPQFEVSLMPPSAAHHVPQTFEAPVLPAPASIHQFVDHTTVHQPPPALHFSEVGQPFVHQGLQPRPDIAQFQPPLSHGGEMCHHFPPPTIHSVSHQVEPHPVPFGPVPPPGSQTDLTQAPLSQSLVPTYIPFSHGFGQHAQYALQPSSSVQAVYPPVPHFIQQPIPAPRLLHGPAPPPPAILPSTQYQQVPPHTYW